MENPAPELAEERDPMGSEFSEEVRAFLICEKTIVSKDNKWSLVNIFDRILVDPLPANVPFSFFASISVAPGPHAMKLLGIGPEKGPDEIASFDVEVGPRGNHVISFNIIMNVQEYGTHHFSLLVDGKEFHKTVLYVEKPEKTQNNGGD